MGHTWTRPTPKYVSVFVFKNHVAFSDFFFLMKNMWFWYNFSFVYLGLVVKPLRDVTWPLAYLVKQ